MACFGRFPITAVQPAVEGGKFPAKAVVGETMVVGATAFREGHDQLGVSAVLLDPRGKERQRVRLAPPRGPRGMGTDRWEGLLTPSGTGNWSFVIEAWHDRYGTWHHNAEVKVEAGIDVELMLPKVRRAARRSLRGPSRPSADRRTLRMAVVVLYDTTKTAEERLAAGFSADVTDVVERQPSANWSPFPSATPCWWSAISPAGAPGTSSSPAPRAPSATTKPASGPRAPSAPPPAARRRRRHGLRHHLHAADPPDRYPAPQGPEQHPDCRTARSRLAWAIGARRAATTPSTRTSAPSRTSMPSWHVPGTGLEVALDLACRPPDHPG